MFIPVAPVAKPRMTRRDKWAQRDTVVRYRDYKDAIRPYAVDLVTEPQKVVFYLPMPKSWSGSKRTCMCKQLHRQKPDVDNLLKGLMDAWLIDDAAVASVHVEKRWAIGGMIEIQPIGGT